MVSKSDWEQTAFDAGKNWRVSGAYNESGVATARVIAYGLTKWLNNFPPGTPPRGVTKAYLEKSFREGYAAGKRIEGKSNPPGESQDLRARFWLTLYDQDDEGQKWPAGMYQHQNLAASIAYGKAVLRERGATHFVVWDRQTQKTVAQSGFGTTEAANKYAIRNPNSSAAGSNSAWSRLQALSIEHAKKLGAQIGGSYRHRQHFPQEVIRENVEILGRGDDEEIKNRIHWYITFHPEIFDATSQYGTRQANPESSAATLYETFHGEPSDETIEYREEEHYPDDLAELGTLVELKVKTVTGLDATLQFEGNAPKLSSTPDGKQFYFLGGDQSIDLDKLKLGSAKWLRDSMVLGDLYELTYRAAKEFHNFKMNDYFHKLGEESGDLPTLTYDTINKRLAIVGGKYRTTNLGIEN